MNHLVTSAVSSLCLLTLASAVPQEASGNAKRDISFGTLIDPAKQLVDSKALAKAQISPSAEGYREKGDLHKKYHFPDTNQDLPYRVYVPSTWDGKVKLPLVMFLHGAWNDESSYLDADDKQMLKLAEKYGFLLVSPLGYEKNGAYGNGLMPPAMFGKPEECKRSNEHLVGTREQTLERSERDVINVLELTLREYPIDRKNMFLMGHSMGSAGTWYLVGKYPKYWNSIASLSGPFVEEATYPWQRLKGKKVFLADGTKAGILMDGTRGLGDYLKKLGFDLKYKEVDADHPGMVPLVLPDVFEFFAQTRK